MDTRNDSIVEDVLLGAVAGAAAVWVMDRVDWFNYRREDPEARRRTQQVRPGGEDPTHVMAGMAEKAVGAELSPAQHHAAGMAIHYAIGAGALYGAVRDRVPGVGTARGALYGLGISLTQDEIGKGIIPLTQVSE